MDKIFRRRDRFDLQPDFQREKVWSLDKEQKLIDTILKRWDIPKIYLNIIDGENFEVIDGQQRLSAIFKFYSNELPLSKVFSNTYGGLYYNDLPDKIKDIFDDYELDLALISEATEEELKELFSRLQLGVPLNSAEKLNALPGQMRDFIKKLSEHTFFSEKTPLRNHRYAFQAICAQLGMLEKHRFVAVKFADLEEFYKNNLVFDENSTLAKRITKVIDTMDQIFDARSSSFKNRAAVMSFYLLVTQLIDKNFEFNELSMKKLKQFYITFNTQLQEEIEKGADAKDSELIVYQSKVNQAADSKDSIKKRDQIIKRRLMQYDVSFKSFLDIAESEDELIELKIKEEIKNLADECVNNIASINKIYSVNNEGQDLFKTTTEFLRGITIIGSRINSKNDFEKFIETLYKMFYEGTGSLNRIPRALLNDNSIFFDIKHLRTDVSHDIQHGEELDITKKRDIITKIYTKYVAKTSVEELDENDLLVIQREILKNLRKELLSIKNNIISPI